MAALSALLILFVMNDLSLSSWRIDVVDSGGDVGFHSSLDIDSSDNPCIAYCDQTAVHMLKYATWDGTTWHKEIVDSDGSVGRFCSLVLDSSDNPHISYLDQSSGYLKYARWNGSAWLIEIVDASGDVGGYTSLALDSNDEPRIAYMKYADTNNPVIEISYASRDGAAWNLEEISSTEIFTGFNISLALDSSEFPHIAYQDYRFVVSYESLCYASWDGSFWSIDTVSTTMSGCHNSLVIDSADIPHISHMDWGNFHVRHTFNPDTMWVFQDIYGTGKYTSISIDSEDNPSISYQSIGDGYLRYAIYNGLSWDNEVVDYTNDGYTSHKVFSDGLPCISYCANGDLRFARRQHSGSEGSTEHAITGTSLMGVFPNPSSGTVSVSISLAHPAVVELTVFDVSGRKVAGSNGDYPEGLTTVGFENLNNGVYFCRMTSSGFEDSQRFVVIE